MFAYSFWGGDTEAPLPTIHRSSQIGRAADGRTRIDFTKFFSDDATWTTA
jgi:hypothetical protein